MARDGRGNLEPVSLVDRGGVLTPFPSALYREGGEAMKKIVVLVVAVMLLVLAVAAPAFAARGGERGPDPLGNIHSGYTSHCAHEAQGSDARSCR
jgi:hypothetical protein